MKHLTLLLLFGILLISCRKDKEIKYTSDAANAFFTHLKVSFNHYENTSTVTASFQAWKEIDWYDYFPLQMPEGSYLKVNDQDIDMYISNYGRYEESFNGQITANFDFVDFDGQQYLNSVTSPDSSYFINLPDTINSNDDLTIDFSGAPLDSDESMIIYFGGYSDDYYHFADHDPDSNKTVVPKKYIESGSRYPVTIIRWRSLLNPNLPEGGGSVTYEYYSEKIVYAQ